MMALKMGAHKMGGTDLLAFGNIDSPGGASREDCRGIVPPPVTHAFTHFVCRRGLQPYFQIKVFDDRQHRFCVAGRIVNRIVCMLRST